MTQHQYHPNLTLPRERQQNMLGFPDEKRAKKSLLNHLLAMKKLLANNLFAKLIEFNWLHEYYMFLMYNKYGFQTIVTESY